VEDSTKSASNRADESMAALSGLLLFLYFAVRIRFLDSAKCKLEKTELWFE